MGPFSPLRNAACAALALGLIARGAVRRARTTALSGSVVTGLYFHKPNRRLFRRCISWLRRHGYRFISADELASILRHETTVPRGAVWLSFDDGCRELLSDVVPLVRRHRIPVTIFIPSGIVKGDGLFPWISGQNGSRHALTVAELKQLARYPEITIGSHTVSHARVTNCTDDELIRELAGSRSDLQAWTGAPVRVFSYPYGDCDKRVAGLLAGLGYSLAATAQNAFITTATDPYLVPRFSIGDEISFAEAVCNMVGIWRPAIDPLKNACRSALAAVGGLRAGIG